MNGVLHGMGTIFRALGYLWRHPSLVPLVLAPMALTLALMVGLFSATLVGAPGVMMALFPRPEDGALLHDFAIGLLYMSLLALAVLGGWVAGNMLSAPIYDVLAGRVENAELGIDDEDFSWGRLFSDAWMSVRHSLAGFALYLAVMLPILSLNLVPVVGSVLASLASALATAFFVAREVMDIPLSRRRMSFRDKLAFLREHRAAVGGHGAVVAVLLMIPLANLLVTPVAVLGASLLFCELEREAAQA